MLKEAPVTSDAQGHPHGNAHPASQVGHRRIRGDNQIEVLQHRRRIHESPGGLIEAAAQIDNVKLLHHRVALFAADAFLQAE